MARKKSVSSQDKTVEYVAHRKDKRVNIPTAELADFAVKEEQSPYILRYPRKPELDPQLVWRGKDEQDGHDLEVPAVPVYIQEHVHPSAIIEDLRKNPLPAPPSTGEGPHQSPPDVGGIKGGQLALFDDFDGMEFSERIDFYCHSHNWTNRMILGDSLLVMASLAEKEGLKGQVQMIYLDPPYGIKFGSNWQVSTRKRDVRDGRPEDATREPEQIRAFRDTWKLGIHSYLAYWRDRLVVARDLLTETGSIFVQIGDENVHLVRSVMDEVFGSENFVALIRFRKKTMPLGGTFLERMGDFLVWYAKDYQAASQKYKQLFYERDYSQDFHWSNYELPDGARHKITQQQLASGFELPSGARRFRLVSLWPASFSANAVFPVSFRGKDWWPAEGQCWPTSPENMQKLVHANLIESEGNYLRRVLYEEGSEYAKLTTDWGDTIGAREQRYVVETSPEVVERCLLMTTDPGDLVLDPTCVRKGTGVWVTPSVVSPHAGRQANSLPVCGEGAGRQAKSLPVCGGGAGRQAKSLPVYGEGWGGGEPVLVAVEQVQPGEWVLAHDGRPHRVMRRICQRYQGKMVGIGHGKNSAILWLTADHRVLAKRSPRSLGGNADWSGSPIANLERRKELRREMTPPERKLWQALRKKPFGAKFRRQHPIGPYIADFYSRDAALVVEVDGVVAHDGAAARVRDGERDAYMESLGLRVLRVAAAEVERNLEGVFEAVRTSWDEVNSAEGAEWVEASELRKGDTVYAGPERLAVRIERMLEENSVEEVYDLEVEEAHSFITEVCAVHNCGSGTTAYVAEQWGRRWITLDTSRVAIALARTRLMSARFPYYILADTPEGIRKQAEVTGSVGAYGHTPLQHDIKKGFVYKRVPHVTLKSIANNPDIREGMIRAQIDAAIARHAESETLYDQPYEDSKVVRVTGPFTVESLSPHRVLSAEQPLSKTQEAAARSAGPGQFETMVLENLKKAGVQQYDKQERIKFDRLEPFAGLYIQGEGEYEENGQAKRVAVCIGPEHGTVGAELVKEAAKEAVRGIGFDLLIVCGFAFDPHVNEEAKRYGKLKVLTAKINPDLQMGDEFLKRTGAGSLFMVFGEPDIEVKKQKDGKLVVEIKGLDVYDPTTGQVRSHFTDDIACWFIDTDYNEECFFVRHAYFCGDDEPYDKLKRALKAEIDEAAWAALYSTVSRPFDSPKTGKIAIKVINHYGDEVMKVYQV